MKICQDRDILRVQAMGMLLICKLFNCTDTDTVAVSNQMAKNTNDPALQAWAFRCIVGECQTSESWINEALFGLFPAKIVVFYFRGSKSVKLS